MSGDDKWEGGPVGYVVLPGAQGLETNVGRPLPVFGAEDTGGESLLMPDPKMTLGHFVVFPKGFAQRVSEEEKAAYATQKRNASQAATHMHNQGVIVGRVTRNREPQQAIEYREGKFVIPSYLGDKGDVASGQTRFYVAANEIRERFIQFSKETMSVLDPELRKMATLVTIADTSIHARPLHAEREYSSYSDQFEERGFEVVAEFRQFVTLGMPRAEIEEFRVHSEQGEYPIIIPRDVEMGMLLRMDNVVMADPTVNHDMTPEQRAARLISKLKGV